MITGEIRRAVEKVREKLILQPAQGQNRGLTENMGQPNCLGNMIGWELNAGVSAGPDYLERRYIRPLINCRSLAIWNDQPSRTVQECIDLLTKVLES